MSQEFKNKSFGEYILIDKEEIPSASEIEAAVERLQKDIASLSSMGSSKHRDQAKSLVPVLSYLELLLARSKK